MSVTITPDPENPTKFTVASDVLIVACEVLFTHGPLKLEIDTYFEVKRTEKPYVGHIWRATARFIVSRSMDGNLVLNHGGFRGGNVTKKNLRYLGTWEGNSDWLTPYFQHFNTVIMPAFIPYLNDNPDIVRAAVRAGVTVAIEYYGERIAHQRKLLTALETLRYNADEINAFAGGREHFTVQDLINEMHTIKAEG